MSEPSRALTDAEAATVLRQLLVQPRLLNITRDAVAAGRMVGDVAVVPLVVTCYVRLDPAWLSPASDPRETACSHTTAADR